jgi:hypothetical protein
VRRYDELRRERPGGTLVRCSGKGGGKAYTFQEWTWKACTDRYQLEHYTLKTDNTGRWDMKKRQVSYRAWSLSELAVAYHKAGFTEIEIMEEALSGFYQPVILARIGKKNMQEKED